MIPHVYFDASDDPGAYEADQCNRQAVTVEWAYEHLEDETVWLFRNGAHDMGLDPWLEVQGIDKRTDGTGYIVEFGRTGEVHMTPDGRVYAQRRDLRKLGLPEGRPGGPKIAPVEPTPAVERPRESHAKPWTPPEAVDVLRRMIDDLHRDGWPSEATWTDASRVLGRRPEVPLDEVAGAPVDPASSLAVPERKSFEPPK